MPPCVRRLPRPVTRKARPLRSNSLGSGTAKHALNGGSPGRGGRGLVGSIVFDCLVNVGDPPSRCGLGGLDLMCVRRCPTLPHPPGCSTIGAVGLSFRVRNGTGRFPHAMTAVTLLPEPCAPVRVVGWEDCGYNIVVLCIQLLVPVSNGLLFGNHIVDACSVVCGVSCWPISTGQLHESLVL